MKQFAVVFAICCLSAAQARPSHHGGGEKLQGVPDLGSYEKLHYPQLDLLELGSYAKEDVPPKVIHITKESKITIPKPYPVKVPYSVPYPVPVAKPYPVVETKFIKVPQQVPVEVIKKIPVPIEVPKPYPVPAEEYNAPSHQADIGNYGGSFEGGDAGYQHLSDSYGVPGQEPGIPLGGGGGFSDGYQGDGGYGLEEHGAADQSGGYSAVAQQESNGGWNPLQQDVGQSEEVQQQIGQEEQH